MSVRVPRSSIVGRCVHYRAGCRPAESIAGHLFAHNPRTRHHALRRTQPSCTLYLTENKNKSSCRRIFLHLSLPKERPTYPFEFFGLRSELVSQPSVAPSPTPIAIGCTTAWATHGYPQKPTVCVVLKFPHIGSSIL